jgi:hypothetical protein
MYQRHNTFFTIRRSHYSHFILLYSATNFITFIQHGAESIKSPVVARAYFQRAEREAEISLYSFSLTFGPVILCNKVKILTSDWLLNLNLKHVSKRRFSFSVTILGAFSFRFCEKIA